MDQHVWNTKSELNLLVPDTDLRHMLKEKWVLAGQSKSALRTGFTMGPFHLDAGHSIFSKWEMLLISHAHADHVFSVGSFVLTGHKHGDIKRFVYAPKDSIDLVHTMCRTVACTGGSDHKPLDIKFLSAIPSNTIVWNDYAIKVIGLSHRLTSVGYCISKIVKGTHPEIKKVLMKYPAHIRSSIMRNLITGTALDNVSDEDCNILSSYEKKDLTGKYEYPQFCYVTDTSIKGVYDNIDLLCTYPIIIVECTFYGRDELEHAEKKTHIHWIHLEKLIRKYPNTLWVLIHTSQRHKNYASVVAAIHSWYDGSDRVNAIPDNVLIWESLVRPIS
jgi:ribonuclease Z